MDAWRALRGPARAIAAGLIVALLFGGVQLVGVVGGPSSVWALVLAVPVLIAGVVFKTAGGVLAGLAAGYLVSPWVQVSAEPLSEWAVRAGFFALIGAFVGQTQALLERRLRHGQHLVRKVATIHARTLSTFASTVELRDEPTGGHSSRVAHNSRALAVAMELERDELRAVYWAGLLHDLGKIGIPERILQKPSRLTEDETTTMRRHSDLGADLLLSVSPDLHPIAEGIRTHHERWDGTGYPRGLAGEYIPLVGRVVSVVDVFEALTCKRPYREAQPVQEVLAFLRDRSGWWFDPTLVRFLEDLYWKGQIYTADAMRAPLPVEEPAAVMPMTEGEGSLLRIVSGRDYHAGTDDVA
jgi:HD domain-containing protein